MMRDDMESLVLHYVRTWLCVHDWLPLSCGIIMQYVADVHRF